MAASNRHDKPSGTSKTAAAGGKHGGNRMQDTGESSDTAGGQVRLSETVYEQIIQMIVGRTLVAGQSISESELSRRLQVSRTPIHEAVGRLVQDGLLIQPPNRRPVVAALSAEDVFDIFEMRRILESEAAAKASVRMDRPTLEKLRDAADDFANSRGKQNRLQRWTEFDDRFHAAIADACGSRRLKEDIQRYRLLHRVFNRTHSDPNVLDGAYQEHLEILQALCDRDPDAARQSMNDHIAEWQRFFVRHLT